MQNLVSGVRSCNRALSQMQDLTASSRCRNAAARGRRRRRTRGQGPRVLKSAPTSGALSSGCPDLNWGPLRPERSALPGCATPRAVANGSRLDTERSSSVRYGCHSRQQKEESVNTVALIGNLATDVELKEIAPDKKVAKFL